MPSLKDKVNIILTNSLQVNYILIFLGIVVSIFTFPSNHIWTYSPGIDSSLIWVFNYLFEADWEIGKNIIFPHGPLAFLMYPTGNNVLIATVVTVLFKILLVISIFHAFTGKKMYAILWAFLITYLLSTISGFNHLLLANLIFHYIAYYNTRIRYFKIVALILTSFALFIKAYVAIISLLISISFITYSLICWNNFKDSIRDILLIILFTLLIWLNLYSSFDGFLSYFIGIIHLAEDNSSAASYYPNNNWVLIGLSIFTFILIPFLNKTKRTHFYIFLVGLSLFAAWKHGMAREDFSHQKGMIVYMIILVSAFLVFEPKKKIINILLGISSILLFSFNIKNAVNSKPIKYSFFKGSNFVEFVTSFQELKTNSRNTSLANIRINKLPTYINDSINGALVDIYPWDFTVIPANNLNWQPRIVIQSYAAYTSWLDQQNEVHFNSEKAPEYLIWSKRIESVDINGNHVSSIDQRYLLNDEPNTLLSFLSRYKFYWQNDRFLVLTKKAESSKYHKTIMKSEISQWGEWVDIPESESTLLRARLRFDKSFIQKAKSLLYKDEQFWIYLKLKDGRIHKYRIVPKNSEDGIWITPYIYNDQILDLDQIMLINSNSKIINNNLSIDWESIDFIDNNIVSKFFALNTTIYSRKSQLFEYNSTDSKWVNNKSTNASSELDETKIESLKENNLYSHSFKLNLDSIEIGTLISIDFDAWIKTKSLNKNDRDKLIITIKTDDSTLAWESFNIDRQMIDQNQWNHFLAHFEYLHLTNNSTLKIYFLNKKRGYISLIDPKIRVY